ncbi:28917_t:CDS:2 [Gigaspora margarita]|uniref:28917_t:CDS:1 n=1 Tax=Gigaspora margarita TaxID=4874 RepID=A0ABM8W098_GIGMA|nr:28917_t:CDS:2 [Gigaspora margarita]
MSRRVLELDLIEIKRYKKESHINLLNQEIQRAKILEEKLRLKEITIENANQELNKLRQEIILLKGIIEEKNKTINALQEENGNLRNTNEELTVENITQLENRIFYFENREKQRQRGELVDPYLPRSNAFIGEHEFNQQFNQQ